MVETRHRAGRYVRQPGGYRAFIPKPLPPDPPLDDSNLLELLSDADAAVERLDAIAARLPAPERVSAMYVRREAEASSRIEGLQSSLDDIVLFEAQPASPRLPPDIVEVANAVRALEHGIERLATLPLSNRLLREMHFVLLDFPRGQEQRPGEFRSSQNWIGPPGATLMEASFVPPPASELPDALGALERYLHTTEVSPLVQAALAHAQFEIIHPFLDGNGRIGRMLISLLLQHRGVLRQPVLFLSSYLQRFRAQYYEHLVAIREHGDWEGWVVFFLRAVAATATEATDAGTRLIELYQRDGATASRLGEGDGPRVLDELLSTPVAGIDQLVERLDIPEEAVASIMRQLVELGIVTEIRDREHAGLFRYDDYIEIFRSGPVFRL